MKTKLLSLIYILLLGNLAWGQGAATPELAWDNRPSNGGNGNQYDYWFELDVDSDGSAWISKRANARTLPFNTGSSNLPVFPMPIHGQTSFDERTSFILNFPPINIPAATGYMSVAGTRAIGAPLIGYEEWYVIKVPSSKNINITVDISLALNNDPNGFDAYRWGTTIQWYEIDNASELTNIARFPVESNSWIKGGLDYQSNGNNPLLNFDIDSTLISKKYILLRIGNNDVSSIFFGYQGLIKYYDLTISTNNIDCENALDFPDNAIQVDPFISTTDASKDLLDGSGEIDQNYYDNNQASGMTGSGITSLPSNSSGEWFKITTKLDSMFFTACGTSYDAQLLVFDDCPSNSGQIIGAENDNLFDGSDLNWNGGTDVCINPVDPNPPTNPVLKVFTGNTSTKTLYAYLFGNSASGSFEFYILREGNDVLPVDWLGFTGTPSGNTNRLDWSTATETQNDYFNLEKSADGIHYENMAQIEGKGDAIFQNDYSILDEKPYYQTYYRISQVDYDGTVNSGPQIVVINDLKKVFIHLLSNPIINNEIKLRYRSDREQEVVFYLTGLDGKRIRNQTVNLLEGSMDLNIAIPGVVPGLYLLSARVNNEQWTEKIVVR